MLLARPLNGRFDRAAGLLQLDLPAGDAQVLRGHEARRNVLGDRGLFPNHALQPRDQFQPVERKPRQAAQKHQRAHHRGCELQADRQVAQPSK